MHRRLFLQQSSFLAAGFVPYTPFRHTKHLIFIVNGGGARKMDYYENDSLCPNIRKMASEGFVFFWGPDFVTGVDRTTVISRLDMAPTLASLFGVKALYAEGRVMPGLIQDRTS